MAISLQDAVDDLYRIAITERSTQAPNRLDLLADMCIDELENRGVLGVKKEMTVPGFGRNKKWDVAWSVEGNVKLAISLKSLLRNIRGTVPNRIDDFMGEMANVQLRSPEIVTGYVMIVDAKSHGDGYRRDGTKWVDYFRDCIEQLSGRDAPSWATGMVEASAVISVDFAHGARVLEAPNMNHFFNLLAGKLYERNPELLRRGYI